METSYPSHRDTTWSTVQIRIWGEGPLDLKNALKGIITCFTPQIREEFQICSEEMQRDS